MAKIEEEKCTCYRNDNDKDSWASKSLDKLASILKLGENYKLMGGDKAPDTKCPLHHIDEPGYAEQYAFEQAVLQEVLQEKSEIERSRLHAVPAPCLYKRKDEATPGGNCREGEDGRWCQHACPDLILFSEDKKKLWVVEVMAISEDAEKDVRDKQKKKKRKDARETAKKFFENRGKVKGSKGEDIKEEEETISIPEGWSLEVVLVELKIGIKTAEDVKQDLELSSSDSDSVVNLITRGRGKFIRGRKRLEVVLRKP